MKKIITSVMAFVALCGLTFGQELSFENEVSSDVIQYEHWKDSKQNTDGSVDDLNETDFAGISEKMSVAFKSQRVDFGVEAEFSLDDFADDVAFEATAPFYEHIDDYKGVYGLQWTDFDWYVEFRPIDILTLGLHDTIWTPGSYLPVWDDNVSTGNLGSNGFTTVLRPLGDALRIAATLPFSRGVFDDDVVNWLNGKEDDGFTKTKFDIGFGADYNFEDKFTLGVNIQNLTDGDIRSWGLYASVALLPGIEITAGYTNAAKDNAAVLEEVDLFGFWGIGYESLITAGLSFEENGISTAFDLAFNLDKNVSIFDFYIGAQVARQLSQQLSVGVQAVYLSDFGNDDEDSYASVFGVKPFLSYQINERNTFNAAAALEIQKNNFFLKFPISWVYTF